MSRTGSRTGSSARALGPWARVLRSRRGRIGVLVLAMLALFAVFAEWIVGDAPVLIVSTRSIVVMPAVTQRWRAASMPTGARELMVRPGEHAVWPVWRSGPTKATERPFAPASWAHPLGTDAFGRDVLARLVYGTRTMLLLAGAIAAISVVLGCMLGGLSGVLGGMWDSLVQQIIEAVGVFPAVVLVALVRALERGGSIVTLGAVVALVRWAETTKLVRTLVLRSLAEDWAVAAQAVGATPARLLWKHVAPHLVTPVLVSATFSVGSVVLTEAALSFLGLGVPVAVPSWGEMLGEVRWGAGPAVLLPPAIALAVALAAVYQVARAMRETTEELASRAKTGN